MVQREGRIIRRGNENEDVFIYRYITEGSFDSYSWQILETKQRFISQFLTGSSYQRTASDLENNVLTYAEVKALALSEPLMKQLAEKENEIKNLRIIITKEEETHKDMEKELHQLSEQLPLARQRYWASKEFVEILSKKKTKEFQEEYQRLKDVFTNEVLVKTQKLDAESMVMGFSIVIPDFKENEKMFLYLEQKQVQYKVEMGDSSNGNARRIINVLKNFDKVVEEDLKEMMRISERIKELQSIIAATKEESVYSKQLRQCEKEVESLKEIIQMT